MGSTEEAYIRFVENYLIVEKFLFIFPLEESAKCLLWSYGIFFGTLHKYTVLYEPDLSLLPIPSYGGFMWMFSLTCFMTCMTSVLYQRAKPWACRCIFYFMLVCFFRVIWKILTTTTQEGGFPRLDFIYLNEMYDFFKLVNYDLSRYLCYFMFNVTVCWHILQVIFSHHRERYIPDNPTLQSTSADLHIKSTVPEPTASTSFSNRKEKKSAEKSTKDVEDDDKAEVTNFRVTQSDDENYTFLFS